MEVVTSNQIYSERIKQIKQSARIIDSAINNNSYLFMPQGLQEGQFAQELNQNLQHLYDVQDQVIEEKIRDLENKVAISAKMVADILVFDGKLTSTNIEAVRCLNHAAKKHFPELLNEMKICQTFESQCFIEQGGIGSCSLLGKFMIAQSFSKDQIYIKGNKVIFVNSTLRASKLKLDKIKSECGYEILVNEKGFVSAIKIDNNDFIQHKKDINKRGEEFTISNNPDTKIIVTILEEIFNPLNGFVEYDTSLKIVLLTTAIAVLWIIGLILLAITSCSILLLVLLFVLAVPLIYRTILTLTRKLGLFRSYDFVGAAINNLFGIKRKIKSKTTGFINRIPDKIDQNASCKILLGYKGHAYVLKGKKNIGGKIYLQVENPHGQMELLKLSKKDFSGMTVEVISYKQKQTGNKVLTQLNNNIDGKNIKSSQIFFKVPKKLNCNFTGIKFARYLYFKGNLVCEYNLYQSLRLWYRNMDPKLRKYSGDRDFIRFIEGETDELDFKLSDNVLNTVGLTRNLLIEEYIRKITNILYVFHELHKKNNIPTETQDDCFLQNSAKFEAELQSARNFVLS